MSANTEFPLSEAPAAGRKGLLSISMVLFSFTFFTGTMFAGGKLGVAFPIVEMLWIATIGNLLLADGRSVKGFICEPWALADALDITEFGGWRAFIASRG